MFLHVFSTEEIARWFGVPLHLVTHDLPPGYWERELARQIACRSVRARLRRALYQLRAAVREIIT